MGLDPTGPAQQEGSVHSSVSPQQLSQWHPRPGALWRFPLPRVLHGLEPWCPPALGKTLISAVAGEFTLNFVVDKGHSKGRCRPLVCREDTNFGYSCVLFQSGSSKKVAIQCVCVCRITVELQTWLCIFSHYSRAVRASHTLVTSAPPPTPILQDAPSAPESHRQLRVTAHSWDSASCSRA